MVVSEPRPYKWCRFRHRYRIHWSVSGAVYSRLRAKDDGGATGGIGRRNVAVAVPRRYLRRDDFRRSFEFASRSWAGCILHSSVQLRLRSASYSSVAPPSSFFRSLKPCRSQAVFPIPMAKPTPLDVEAAKMGPVIYASASVLISFRVLPKNCHCIYLDELQDQPKYCAH